MKRTLSFRTIVNYTVLAIILLLGYKFFTGGNSKKTADPFREKPYEHPRNIKVESEVLDKGHNYNKTESHDDKKKHMDVGDLPKNLKHDVSDDLMYQKEKKFLKKEFANKENGQKEKKFLEDGIDWDLEEEMKKRRTVFFENLRNREEELKEGDFMNMHESDDDFAFVTAGSHSTYPATIQFIYSVQYFYPMSQIGIYDIGLTSDEKEFINALCNTEVITLWLQMWPETLYKVRHRVWRPLVLQFASAKYGHYIYVEPGRFIFKQAIKKYLDQSRIHGVTVGGRQLKYSSYVVTNPHMYTFLTVDEKKLKKTPHFDFTMVVYHNTKRVRNFFMRYLMTCILEEYCISPPGAKANCDLNMGNHKKYAHCHRYDESAMNLILNRWHNYKPREYLMRDQITRYFDGKDMSNKVKVCNKNEKDEV